MMAAKVCHISAGNFANVVGWEDVTLYLSGEEGRYQAIEVALERDKEPYGKVATWYRLSAYHYDTSFYKGRVIPLEGTFRYVRVIGERNEELAFSIAGKVPK